MSFTTPSKTELILLNLRQKIFLAYLESILEILNQPNDLSIEQANFWLNEMIEIQNLAGNTLATMKDALKRYEEYVYFENSSCPAVPYKNAHLN